MTDRNRPLMDALEAWTAATSGEDAASVALPRPRSVAAGACVQLREINGETVREICRLAVGPGQHGFVAPNAVSLAEAHFSPEAWPRAVYADDVPVGFAMLSLHPEKAEYHLWRFMIAAPFQRLGFGEAALLLLVDHVRTLPGATALVTSWVPEDGGPEPFYRGLGFEPTGEVDGGEVVGRLQL